MTLMECIDNICIGLQRGKYADEPKVRDGIVRPVLDALNWPIHDVDVVIPEYSLKRTIRGKKQIDLALCHTPLKPQAFIKIAEVRRINESVERQLFEYASHERVPILILTDGKEWHFFYTTGSGTYEERRICKLDLIEQDSDEVTAYLIRYLDYESICSGATVEAIEEDYQNISKQRQMKSALPEAWAKLVQEKGEFLLECVAEKTKELSGDRPTADLVWNFLSDLENKQVTTQEKRPKSADRKPTTRLIVTMNGEKIAHRNAKDTFVEAIERLGIERVKNIGIAPIFTSKPKSESSKLGQYYLITQSPTKRKKEMLEDMASELGVSLTVEIVEKRVRGAAPPISQL